jgi:hypothetical protein
LYAKRKSAGGSRKAAVGSRQAAGGRRQLVFTKNGQLQNHYYNRDDEHKQRNPVYAMHVLHPLRIWLVRVSFFNIQVLGNLT